MKTKLFLSFLLFTFYFLLAGGQVPQGFNYQAIARDGSGNPLVNQSLPVKLTIQADSIGALKIWQEEHLTATSNSFGLISVVIGRGRRTSESTVPKFSDIDWSISPKFIKAEIYSGGSYKTLGVSRLWSVPFSSMAGDLSGPVDKLQVKGTTSTLEEALFEVKNRDGQTVFAVYNEGVRIYVSDGAKAVKGGFAVGGFGTDKAESTKYFFVGKDSVRIYLDTDTLTKGKKSGFAVGGYDLTKGTVQEYLKVNADSTRIYVNNKPGKGVKGGFAVGGFDLTKGNITPFTSLTPQNYLIGHRSGESLTTGKYNSFLGYEAGRSTTTGEVNVFLGPFAGRSNTSGSYNVMIGDSSGVDNTTGEANIMIGPWAGFKNTTGNRNVIIGVAGYETSTGSYNVMLGTFSGNKNNTGSGNVYVGDYAGANISNGNDNVFIGKSSGSNSMKGKRNIFLGAWSGRNVDSANFCVYLGPSAGWNSKQGQRNIFIGPFAGYNNQGTDNVFIGNEAGYYETGSNRLYIANMQASNPLIFGEFDNGRVVINGISGDNVFRRTLFVNGTAGGMEPWYNDSDRRLKTEIFTIPDALEKVLRLRGVNFRWNDPSEGMEGLQMGFIGQEAAEVIPEVVSIENDHYSMQYAPITALLVNAVKEQQQIIEEQNKKITRLELLVEKLISSDKVNQ